VMDISFKTKKIEKLLRDPKKLRKAYPQLADNIMARLDLLAEADNLADIPHDGPPRRHQLRQDRDEVFAIDVKSRREKERIIFEVGNNPIPRAADQGIILSEVTRIKNLEISDHYR
jgi:plasmid maintenance system killer protein